MEIEIEKRANEKVVDRPTGKVLSVFAIYEMTPSRSFAGRFYGENEAEAIREYRAQQKRSRYAD